jgi:CheY-like chemotaxis protein
MSDRGGILLVEDNPNDIEVILTALEESRVIGEVFVTRDGEQALDYLNRRGLHELWPSADPKLVLLDLKLPKINVLEALQRIKTDLNLNTIPVMMLTPSRDERDILESYNFGTNAYIVKPMGFQEFVEVIEEVGLFWGVLDQSPTTMEWRP